MQCGFIRAPHSLQVVIILASNESCVRRNLERDRECRLFGSAILNSFLRTLIEGQPRKASALAHLLFFIVYNIFLKSEKTPP
jgi:hypothetical protein